MREIVMWLVAHAVRSVGWDMAWEPDGSLLVFEGGPMMTHKPRKWRISCETMP